jgi:hypothetical protein
MKTLLGILMLSLVFLPQIVLANDGFAALGVGGITTTKTDRIALKSEILDISCDTIHVVYDFINESDRDVDAYVMFPLPSYNADFRESGIISHGQPSGFTVTVNGKPVNYDTEVKATLKGRDVTEDLKSAGLTAKQIAHFPFDQTLLSEDHELKISKSQIDALGKKGLITEGSPNWDIQVTYVWKQNFPTKTTVHVEHSYRPFTAEGTFGGYPRSDINQFCLSRQQIQQLERLYADKKNLDGYGQVPGTYLIYILTTANTWKDGIRDFKLRLHTKAADEIVALCFPSKIRRVSDTLYEAHVQHFKPKAELSIYFGNARKCHSNGYGEAPYVK